MLWICRGRVGGKRGYRTGSEGFYGDMCDRVDTRLAVRVSTVSVVRGRSNSCCLVVLPLRVKVRLIAAVAQPCCAASLLNVRLNF